MDNIMKHLSIHEITAFENYKIEYAKFGHVVVSTIIGERSLNIYGKAHGGVLFTLCDQISGLVLLTTGYCGVTLQSNINYLKSVELGQSLLIDGKLIHNGRTTKVVDVLIKNKQEETVAKGTFTMFVTAKQEV